MVVRGGPTKSRLCVVVAALALAGAVAACGAQPPSTDPTVADGGGPAPRVGVTGESVFRMGATVWVTGGVIRESDGALTPNNSVVRFDGAGRTLGTTALPLGSDEHLFWAKADTSASGDWVLGNVCPILATKRLGCSRPRVVLWHVDSVEANGTKLRDVPLPALSPSEPLFATLVGVDGSALLIVTSTLQGVARLHRVATDGSAAVTSVELPNQVDPYVGVCQLGERVFAARSVTADGISLTGIDIVELTVVDPFDLTSASWSGRSRIAVERGPLGTTWLACGESELGVATAGHEPRFAAVNATTGRVSVPVDNPLSANDERVMALDVDDGTFVVTTASTGENATYWVHREGQSGLARSASRALADHADSPAAVLLGDQFLDLSTRSADNRITPFVHRK